MNCLEKETGPMIPVGNWSTCDVCGAMTKDGASVVSLMTRPGHVVTICRNGHFEGEGCDCLTGLPTCLTGSFHLNSLLWFPERFIPRLEKELSIKESIR
jgi:hypothetical protein